MIHIYIYAANRLWDTDRISRLRRPPLKRRAITHSLRVTRRIVYDTAQMRRNPVSTKLNNSQNQGAESATPVTLGTSIQARLF